VFAALSWGIALQLINFIYLLIRKQDGMGFGDIIIITMTAGVPSALAGDAAVGFIGVVASFVLAVVFQLPLAIKRNSGGRTAFALGPYLCSGWIVAWVGLNYAGLVR
jgi:prepilin signal peptidase PulO-like enzyme (type II secretory pathway)